MERWLGRLGGLLYASVRFFAGALFACHGAQKLFGVLGGHVAWSSPKLLAAGIIELGAGTLIALGLAASPAAFLASGEMAVAYFTAHAPHGFWPIVNRGELAVLYCFLFLYVASQGSGGLSLDQALGRKRR